MNKDFKVLCESSHTYAFTFAKIYHVRNGMLTNDFGGKIGPFKNICEINIALRGVAYFSSPMKTYRLSDAEYDYISRDIELTWNNIKTVNKFDIENVIFNGPATIVFWKDGTKTVVKCQDGDDFDPEKGLAMAISKKALGNKGKYFDEIKKWTEPEPDEDEDVCEIYKLLETLSKSKLGAK